MEITRREFLTVAAAAALSGVLGTAALPDAAQAASSKKVKAANPAKFGKHMSKKFRHGKMSKAKYIVLHDTEASAGPMTVAKWWDNDNGGYVAAHFVVGRDGKIVQCVPLSQIAHHAGYGTTGNNKKYGVKVKNDDLKGRQKLTGYKDYGMNSYSIGIEMCHVHGQGYTAKQLKAVDSLIAYIDGKLGYKPKIIDHKAWRAGNSDTDSTFKTYLKNYKKTRTHYAK